MTIFESYPAAKWQIKSYSILFPIEGTITESGGNRLVKRERSYRDGAKIDDTGSIPRSWTFTAVFENSVVEDNVVSKAGDELYPTRLRKMIESFSVHEAGDLTIPTVGTVRARLNTYRRIESADETRDGAKLELTFDEDNEDSVDASSITAPSVNANMRLLGETTQFSAESDGIMDDDFISDFASMMNDLEEAANSVTTTQSDIQSQAGFVRAKTTQVGQTYKSTLVDPATSTTQRKLEQSNDVAARSQTQSNDGSNPVVVTILTDRTRTLMDIAIELTQNYPALLAINPQLPDPLNIPQNTIVKVYDQ